MVLILSEPGWADTVQNNPILQKVAEPYEWQNSWNRNDLHLAATVESNFNTLTMEQKVSHFADDIFKLQTTFRNALFQQKMYFDSNFTEVCFQGSNWHL